MYLYIKSRFEKRQKNLIKDLELQKEYASIELHALQSQMNPHFVFNCLTSIQVLISEGKNTEAKNYLGKFSLLMRKFLLQSDTTITSLKEEIEINQLYLELEKLRFKNKLNFTIKVDPNLSLEKTFVPAVTLQPFIENAIRHGLFHKKEPGNILLDVKKNEAHILIQIIDDGIGIENSMKINANYRIGHQSKGMNMMQRKRELLEIVEKLSMDINIKDNEPSGTKVEIRIFPRDNN